MFLSSGCPFWRMAISASTHSLSLFKGNLIKITDTGHGMTEEVRKRMFDPFFTTRCPEGTGLGMSIAYGVIKRHGGELEVQSRVGKGTTFIINIPVASGKSPAP